MKFYPTAPAIQSGIQTRAWGYHSRISDQVRHGRRVGLWAGHPGRAEASLESCGASLQLSLLKLSFALFVFEDMVCKQHSQLGT